MGDQSSCLKFSRPQSSITPAVTWLKYCRYGVKHKTINHYEDEEETILDEHYLSIVTGATEAAVFPAVDLGPVLVRGTHVVPVF